MKDLKARTMCMFLGLRDMIGFPVNAEAEIARLDLRKGDTVLDFGCGIGSYTIPAARHVGEEGIVYAVDREELALRRVKKRAEREELNNVESILSSCYIGLPDRSIDVAILYGVLPSLDNPVPVLQELHRVLKPDGYLSSRFCFRISKSDVAGSVEATGLYELREQKCRILNFNRIS